MRSVLDASALLAYLRREPGSEPVLDAIAAGTAMSTVNFSEVAGWLVRNGADAGAVRGLRAGLVFPLVPVDDALAIEAALLEPRTRPAGLGIGDRLCLALAAPEALPALTADTAWTGIAEAVGVEVVPIR